MYEDAHEALRAADGLTHNVPQWRRLTNQVTKNRLLIRQNKWREATDSATECLQAANALGSEQLARVFRIQLAEALIGSNRLDKAIETITFGEAVSGVPLSLFGGQQLIAAKSLLAAGLMRRGVQRLGTAKRVLESAGDRLAETEAIDVSEKHGTVDVGDAIGADLDAAVSLLELAGHPQVLGREAFALLKDSGSVESAALGARSSRGGASS